MSIPCDQSFPSPSGYTGDSGGFARFPRAVLVMSRSLSSLSGLTVSPADAPPGLPGAWTCGGLTLTPLLLGAMYAYNSA